ncbi:flagellar hook-length control protein FliK [uncultured Amphritea sp.]|uniref:flagellar hook-length control protein FliK n=1 Tax=uncultured Amphritea sp. TaxID=981605 RepID=UPI00263338F1|nr:flagellar hook-length control protein FliK [uncultured Amphritea sp.]
MNQTLSTANGVGSLLNVGSVSTSTIAGAVSTVTGGNAGAVLPSFGDSLRQAQQGPVVDGQKSSGQVGSALQRDGQNLPGSGQLLPAGGDDSAERLDSQVIVGPVADVTAEVAIPVGERGKLQQLEERLKQQSAIDLAVTQASGESGDDTLQQIDQYRRADLAVAVDSALKQLGGVVNARPVENAGFAESNGRSVASTAAALPSAVSPFESQWSLPSQARFNTQATDVTGPAKPIQTPQRTAVSPGEMSSAPQIVGQTQSAHAEQSFTSAGKMVSTSQAGGQTELIRAQQNGDAVDKVAPTSAAVDGFAPVVDGAVVAGQAGPGVGQSSISPLALNSSAIQSDAPSPMQSGVSQLVTSNAVDSSAEQVVRQREAVLVQDLQTEEIKSGAPVLQNPVASEIAAQTTSVVQASVKSVAQNANPVLQSRTEKQQRVSLEGVPLQAQQDQNSQQSVRQQNDSLLAPSSSPQSQTAAGQSIPQSQLDSQVSADSIREKLKTVGAEGDKSSSSIESAARSEARPESQLTSFADSLAAASRTARPMQEASQLIMPHGARPGEPVWSQAVNDRVMVMASKNGQFADIQLDPPELGSLQVRLHLKNDQVSVVFNTPHGSVREALEQNMPRLREMFADQGLNLSDSSVEDHSRGQQRDESGSDSRSSFAGYQSDTVDDSRVEMVQAESLSLVDYYA